jgi:protein gp37
MANRKKPTGYFFSTGEFFDKEFTDKEIQDRLNFLGDKCSHHRIYISTKQAQRLKNFKFPPNIWLGVSVNLIKDLWRIDELLKTNAIIKYVNFEPLYENVAEHLGPSGLAGIDWVIIGGGTKKGKTVFYPRFSWIKILITIARREKTKIFLKNNLELDPLELIQEFPIIKLACTH